MATRKKSLDDIINQNSRIKKAIYWRRKNNTDPQIDRMLSERYDRAQNAEARYIANINNTDFSRDYHRKMDEMRASAKLDAIRRARRKWESHKFTQDEYMGHSSNAETAAKSSGVS